MTDRDNNGRELRRFATQYPHLLVWVLLGMVSLLGTIGWTYFKWTGDRITLVESRTDAAEKSTADQKAQIRVLDERQQRASDDIKEIKDTTKEIQRDLKELLRQNKRGEPNR